MSSKTTATKENALSKQEIDERLGATAIARLATYRPDGMIHLTPIWYHWNGTQFRLTLGAGRIHLKNLAADNRVSIVIDEDPRLEKGIAAGAWAIMCRGTAELSQDDDLIREVTLAVIGMALGQAHRAVEGDIVGVTVSLGVAFNSTFIALIISLFIMFLMHQLQLLQERLVLDSQSYCDINLLRVLAVR